MWLDNRLNNIMFINRLPPTIKKNRYDFSYARKFKLLQYMNALSSLMIIKQGSLDSYTWLNLRHGLLLKQPFIEIFRGSSLKLFNREFSFLNSDSYWVFVFPQESHVLAFLDYINGFSKKPILVTFLLNGSFFNFTGKHDPYVFLNTNILQKNNSLGRLEQLVMGCPRDVIFLCIHMTYTLLLFIVLLVQYLWSLSEIFIKYNNISLC